MYYQLIKTIKIAEYAGEYFMYDSEITKSNKLRIQTRKISDSDYMLVQKLLKANLHIQPQLIMDIEKILSDEREISVSKRLINEGILEPVSKDGSPEKYEDKAAFFSKSEQFYFTNKLSFFNLPHISDENKAQIALLGVPLSSNQESSECMFTPDYMRMVSQKKYNWLEIFEKGLYSQIGLYESFPRVICKETVLNDYGNINCAGESISEIIDSLEIFIKNELIPNNIKPVFIGGDQVISHPIVNAFNKVLNDVGVIHIDAFNDLFTRTDMVFENKTTIRNMVKTAGIRHLYSFGLRTNIESEVESLSIANEWVKKKLDIKQYSIHTLKQMLYNPELIKSVFENVKDLPFYLTIDMSIVLADDNEGLHFHELFKFIDLIFSEVKVFGCDITECKPSDFNGRNSDNILNLMLLLIEKLSKDKHIYQLII